MATLEARSSRRRRLLPVFVEPVSTQVMPDPTPQQWDAIRATGDVLVLAGAGAGKTTTLVRRILDRVLPDSGGVSVDRLLVVTFTEAAATEMRHRLQAAMEARAAESPGDERTAEQLALLESAQVSTLHAFCLRLLREHFHELALDPQFSVMDSLQAEIMRRDVLAEVLGAYCRGGGANAARVIPFLRRHGGDSLETAGSLILRIHDHARTLPDPEAWLASLRTACGVETPEAWRRLLPCGLSHWAAGWLEEARRLAEADPENFAATESASVLGRMVAGGPGTDWVKCLGVLVEAGRPERFKRGFKGRWRDPLEGLFDEAAEVRALVAANPEGGSDPMIEDWTWVRSDLMTLLGLVEEFGSAYAAARREAAMVDFADLEQLALRLLWNREADAPTPLAQEWRDRMELVMVDEYQDINGAQDRLITCVSRQGSGANRFFVGDVKQSIYRFRRADPRIFQGYARAWRSVEGSRVVPLTENFRSHERILGFVNTLFPELMRPETGGVAYDQESHLLFGAPEIRTHLRLEPEGRIELELHVSTSEVGGGEDSEGSGEASPEELEGEDAQAASAARWLADLRNRQTAVWDGSGGAHRHVEWRDMVVLHPAPRPVAEVWARQFRRAGVPFETRRGGFFAAHEVSDLVNLIRLLDNPRQDLPLLAVLRSPLVGMNDAELAAVRLARRRGSLWDALVSLAGEQVEASRSDRDEIRPWMESARAWGQEFLGRLGRWRRLARERSLSLCLETVLAETGYDAWLKAQPQSEARKANVRTLLEQSRQFDQFQRHGLFRFLQYLEGQAEAEQEVESAPGAGADCVRMMSIHQSKGLEFPVVVVAGLGRRFNRRDLGADWLLDEEYGVCPPVVPPGQARGYHSLPRWLAEHRQLRELLGEQIRLLYVACTRAAERLLLVGKASESALRRWANVSLPLTDRAILRANTPIDWLGPILTKLTGRADWSSDERGVGRWINWRIVRSIESVVDEEQPNVGGPVLLDPDVVNQVRQRLEWVYPFVSATTEPAKMAVTGLTRRWAADDEATLIDTVEGGPERYVQGERGGSEAAIERGLVHHSAFELVDLGATRTREGLEAEIRRLIRNGWLSEERAALLDIEGLWGFWNSDLAERIRRHPKAVHRELPFTARLGRETVDRLRGVVVADGDSVAFPRDADAAGLPEGPSGSADGLRRVNRSPALDGFQVVQGVVDLALIEDQGICLVDFKTDRIEPSELPSRVAHYRLQIGVYAEALSSIYRRPVIEAWLYFVALRELVPVELPTG